MKLVVRFLEIKHLKDFCSKQEIDTEFIDNSLTYHENMAVLKRMTRSSYDLNAEVTRELVRQIESLNGSFDNTPLYQRYGITERQVETMDIPIVFFNFWFKVPYNLYGLVNLKLRRFKHTVTWFSKWYFKVTGTKRELLEVLDVLPSGITMFKQDKPYVKGHVFTGNKWIKLPEEPILQTQYYT